MTSYSFPWPEKILSPLMMLFVVVISTILNSENCFGERISTVISNFQFAVLALSYSDSSWYLLRYRVSLMYLPAQNVARTIHSFPPLPSNGSQRRSKWISYLSKTSLVTPVTPSSYVRCRFCLLLMLLHTRQV